MTATTEPSERAVLLPCPYCGGRAQLIGSPYAGYYGDCEFSCTTVIMERHEAIAAWNNRATDETIAALRRDAERYRELFAGPEPFCFRGQVYDTKAEADAAIDAVLRQAETEGGG